MRVAFSGRSFGSDDSDCVLHSFFLVLFIYCDQIKWGGGGVIFLCVCL